MCEGLRAKIYSGAAGHLLGWARRKKQRTHVVDGHHVRLGHPMSVLPSTYVRTPATPARLLIFHIYSHSPFFFASCLLPIAHLPIPSSSSSPASCPPLALAGFFFFTSQVASRLSHPGCYKTSKLARLVHFHLVPFLAAYPLIILLFTPSFVLFPIPCFILGPAIWLCAPSSTRLLVSSLRPSSFCHPITSPC